MAILAKNQTEPGNGVFGFLRFRRLEAVENGGASCTAGTAESIGGALSSDMVIVRFAAELLGFVPHHVDDSKGERQQDAQDPSEIPHTFSLFSLFDAQSP